MAEENIKVLKNSEVTEIINHNNKIKEVKINNNLKLECDYLVCNSDPPNVYKNLIKSKKNYGFLFNHKNSQE
jgi:hypothetical protein